MDRANRDVNGSSHQQQAASELTLAKNKLSTALDASVEIV